MKRKVISCLLTLVMLLTLSPAVTLTARADTLTTVVVNRANEVLGYLISGGYHIVLNSDMSLIYNNETMTTLQTLKGKNVLDLNGHTLSYSNDNLDCSTSTLFEIPADSELTIMDSRTDGELRYKSYLGDRGTIVYRDLFDVKGKLTINGGLIEAGRSKSKYVAGHGTVWWQTFGTAINVYEGGSVIINGGTIRGRGDNREAIFVKKGGSLLINNAYVNGKGGADCIEASSNADVTIRNGIFKGDTLYLIKYDGKIYGGPPKGNSGIYSTFYDSSITTVINNVSQYRGGSIYESFDLEVITDSSAQPPEPVEIPVIYQSARAEITAGQEADIKLEIDRDPYQDKNGYIPSFDGITLKSGSLPEGMTDYSNEADRPGIVGTPAVPGLYHPVFSVELYNQSTGQRWVIEYALTLMVLDPYIGETSQSVELKKDVHLDKVIPLDLNDITGGGYYDLDLESGQLPEGLDYGLGEADPPYISGTPKEAGTFNPVFLATLRDGVQIRVFMTITVTDPSDPSVVPGPPETHSNPFEDIMESDEYYDAILWAYYADPQITNGMDETHFGPALTVTRGQAVTFLWRSQGCPEPSSMYNPFEDVSSDKYYYKPILWAVETGITKGVDQTHFNPMDTLSTLHIVTFLFRTVNPGMDGWYGEAEEWAADQNGRPFGVNITVDNTTPCPRANVVQFLYTELALGNKLSEDDLLMYVEDVGQISGRGYAIAGRINGGSVKKDDTIRILTFDQESNKAVERTYTVKSISKDRKEIQEAFAGDNIFILLREMESISEIQIGDLMVGKDVPMYSQTVYTGTLTLKTREEGGRDRPIYNEYIPAFYIGTTDVIGTVTGISEKGLYPGESAESITITLIHPAAACFGQELAVREGGRTVGTFTVERVGR